MPFTPAHPAILLPARVIPRKYISWTALILGSMVPDMEYFLFLNPGSKMSHTLYGILNFNLPITVLLAMAWHQFAGPILLRAIPFFRNFYSQLHDDYAGYLSKNWLVFLISALVGICSHLILDGFCHANGFMVHRIPYLREMVTVMGMSFRRCYLVWYVASCINFKSVISALAWKQMFSMRMFFLRVIMLAGLIAGVRILFGLSWNVVRHLVVIALGATFYAVLLATMYERYLKKN
jgi:hypothetical protein